MATIIFCDSVQPLPLFFVDIAERKKRSRRRSAQSAGEKRKKEDLCEEKSAKIKDF
ncbi:MAG: hypothetical protein J5547_03335 [Clostridia bacterium]|nr:hypothetical protein [Clostridia bacterium]MBO7549408.1 hypothetical protein [Clostridia bacterium]